MVKGISKQVIVVQSPDRKLFEQAIFILNESAVNQEGITDDMLLQEAKQAVRSSSAGKRRRLPGPAWACCGAAVTGAIWLLSLFF